MLCSNTKHFGIPIHRIKLPDGKTEQYRPSRQAGQQIQQRFGNSEKYSRFKR
ncbi:hypothetical protein NEIMUCOT_05413 [Neisseria mucosa ATCC 25996]|uniref:Uncharacterized protein n=1 Tax=Neisseria mucosa (strain ATCC 25996 / DSM 4631 / NCTC 10774 / M26) TaxID=546266 RepID=D2ZXQ9_NEIM2|nr:hypothetical protein NEIMUCOT_05413 [Neisseria mucosa ATCC 25996]